LQEQMSTQPGRHSKVERNTAKDENVAGIPQNLSQIQGQQASQTGLAIIVATRAVECAA